VIIRRGLTQEGEGSNVGVGSPSPPSKGHNISKAITKIVLGNNHARLKSYIKYLFIYLFRGYGTNYQLPTSIMPN
jgi:hypothetical protein